MDSIYVWIIFNIISFFGIALVLIQWKYGHRIAVKTQLKYLTYVCTTTALAVLLILMDIESRLTNIELILFFASFGLGAAVVFQFVFETVPFIRAKNEERG